MREKLRFLGLDVHAETIAVAVAEPDGEVRSLGTIANREDSIRKFIRRLGPTEHLRACYEAGPTGFVLYWQLTQLSVECAVVARSLVPKKPRDRVKTDRRDALKLALSHRSGDASHIYEDLLDASHLFGLPPGYRFLLAGDYLDVWYDEALLNV
jgi:transposase